MKEESHPRSWERIEVETDAGDGEETAAFLAELTGAGVESILMEDEGAPGRERIVAYFTGGGKHLTEKTLIGTFLDGLRARRPSSPPRLGRSGYLPEEDWQRIWKKHFRPVRVTAGLTVTPPWEEYTPVSGEEVLTIDPGMAFGTGLHATTRLVLEFLGGIRDAAPAFPGTVLDVGTGSGILAMACALFGASKVLAVDNDPPAVSAAAGNILRNGLEKVVEASGRDLGEINGFFDLITANIVHGTLVEIAPAIGERLAAPGVLICSGILSGPQEESLRGEYEKLGLRCVDSKAEGEWSALKFVREVIERRP